jgi:2'-5' RNA ligase
MGPAIPPGSMRLFLAVFPPRAVQEDAARVMDALRTRRDDVAWVQRKNLHYTLRFLGDQDAIGARLAAEAAREVAAAQGPFGAVLDRPGAFPDAARARVLWLGMREGAETLGALAGALEQALRARGFERADRLFEPHLTIGRLRASGDWRTRLAAAPDCGARFRVEELLLVQSTLSPGGSRYDVRERVALGSVR